MPSPTARLQSVGVESSSLHQHYRHSQLPAMRQAQLNPPDSHHPSQLSRPPTQRKRRLPTRLALYLKLLPTPPAADSGSQGFRSCLLRRKSRGKAFCRVLLPHAISNLSRCKDPLQKPLSEPVYTLLHSSRLNQIRTHSNHHLKPRPSVLLRHTLRRRKISTNGAFATA